MKFPMSHVWISEIEHRPGFASNIVIFVVIITVTFVNFNMAIGLPNISGSMAIVYFMPKQMLLPSRLQKGAFSPPGGT